MYERYKDIYYIIFNINKFERRVYKILALAKLESIFDNIGINRLNFTLTRQKL